MSGLCGERRVVRSGPVLVGERMRPTRPLSCSDTGTDREWSVMAGSVPPPSAGQRVAVDRQPGRQGLSRALGRGTGTGRGSTTS